MLRSMVLIVYHSAFVLQLPGFCIDDILRSMPEIGNRVSREPIQLARFAKGIQEIHHSPNKPKAPQRGVLSALYTIIPNETRASGILENPQRMSYVDTIIKYQIGLNDRIDFAGSGRNDINDLVEKAEQREGAKKADVLETIGNLPEDEQDRGRASFETSVREVECMENWIRERRDTGHVSFAEVDLYRNIVNAINNVFVTSIIFGPDSLHTRTQPLSGTLDAQSVADKYSWVLGDNPQNTIEKAVMIMHNTAMALQVVDDWRGQNIDELLNIPTYASAALSLAANDKSTAHALLWRKKDEYKTKARNLGLSSSALKGAMIAFGIGFRVTQAITHSGRKSETLKRRLLQRGMPMREQAYIEKRLDVQSSSA